MIHLININKQHKTLLLNLFATKLSFHSKTHQTSNKISKHYVTGAGSEPHFEKSGSHFHLSFPFNPLFAEDSNSSRVLFKLLPKSLRPFPQGSPAVKFFKGPFFFHSEVPRLRGSVVAIYVEAHYKANPAHAST